MASCQENYEQIMRHSMVALVQSSCSKFPDTKAEHLIFQNLLLLAVGTAHHFEN